MPSEVRCDLCERTLPSHESFVVRMEVFADPSMPPVTSEELASTDFEQVLTDLLDQMQHMTADQLQDGVHRRFEFRLCPTCHRRFLTNPLGRPREVRAGVN
jgi:hypothetical protein